MDTTNTSIKSITRAVIFLKSQSIYVSLAHLETYYNTWEVQSYKLDYPATKCFNNPAQSTIKERTEMTLQASTLNDLGHGVTAHVYRSAITGNDDGIWISRNSPLITAEGAGAIKVMRWRNFIIIEADRLPDLRPRDGFTHSPTNIFFAIWLVDDDPEDLFDEA